MVLNKVRKNARQLPEYPVIQHRRNLTLEEHRRVIWLRFGSLDSMDKPWLSSKEVFLKTGVRPSTQYNIIKRWLLHGRRIITMVSMRGPDKMLSYAHRVFIANPRTLMEMRHLSLIQRAEALKQRLGLKKLSPSTVWRCYKEFGAKYIKPKVVYRSKNERQQELCSLQQRFSQEVLRLIMHEPDVEIVYIDETSFNIWQSPSRVWLKQGMRVELPNTRGASITMIGVVSTQRGLFHTHTFATTNNVDTFMPFITTLR